MLSTNSRAIVRFLLVGVLAAALIGGAVAGPEVNPAPRAISGQNVGPSATALALMGTFPVGDSRRADGTSRGLAADVGNPLFDVLPEIRNAPAPKWVKPGSQITYHWLSGTVPKDADDEDAPRGGSEGVSQVTVTAAGRKTVTVDQSMYLNPGLGKPLRLLAGVGSVEPAGAAAGYWAPPDVLAQLPARLGPNTVSARVEYTAGGRTFDAIRIQSNRPTGREALVFDRASGVLLHSNHIVATAKGTSSTFVTFLGRRTLELPWAAGGVPDWVADLQEMKYAGTQVLRIPGVEPISLPVAVAARVTARGSNWMTYEQAVTASGGPGLPDQTSATPRSCGPTQIGGLWVPPDGLADLRRGQAIDDDPFTGMKTVVSGVGRDHRGRTVVEIAQENAAQRLTFTYDRETGALVRFSRVDRYPVPSETTLTLRSVK